MIEQIKNLTMEERDILFKAPILVSVLTASWDHEISSHEKKEIIELEHIKTFSANPLLISYYKEVEKDLKKHYDETIKKYSPFDNTKREELKKEINKLNTVIAKLDVNFAKALHKSLATYAENVRNAFKSNLLLNFIFPIPIPGLTD